MPRRNPPYLWALVLCLGQWLVAFSRQHLHAFLPQDSILVATQSLHLSSKDLTTPQHASTTTPAVEAQQIYNHTYPPPFEIYHLHKGMNVTSVSLAIAPCLGAHRPDKDAVMTVASGYQIGHLIYFLTSLLETGYDGDVVFGMGTDMSNETRAFLEYFAKHHNVVVYEIQLLRRNRLFQVMNFFQTVDENGSRILLEDIRQPRQVAQLRFEYYWAWSTRYNPQSRILVTDARDVYFQLNPFEKLPKEGLETTLHVYEDTASIALNLPESNWVRNIYNVSVLNQIKHLPGLCSGTTLGGQPAMEMYNRAMVKEFDEHPMSRVGMDQGRHIGLILLDKLVGSPNITTVNKIKLGSGEVNTIGVPLKNLRVPLEKWKGYDSETQSILNDDGTPSPVVHMFDRNALLKEIITNRTNAALLKWSNKIALAES